MDIDETLCMYEKFTWNWQCHLPFQTKYHSEQVRMLLALQIIDINWAATQTGAQLLIRCVRTKPNMFLKGTLAQLSVWKEHKGTPLFSISNHVEADNWVMQVFAISSMLCCSYESCLSWSPEHPMLQLLPIQWSGTETKWLTQTFQTSSIVWSQPSVIMLCFVKDNWQCYMWYSTQSALSVTVSHWRTTWVIRGKEFIIGIRCTITLSVKRGPNAASLVLDGKLHFKHKV